MKNGKIGYAVVGLGIGKAHVDAAAASAKCELVAVCDLIQEKMDKVVERYPGTKTDVLKNIDLAQIMALAEQGVLGKLVEVESAEGDTVEVVVE